MKKAISNKLFAFMKSPDVPQIVLLYQLVILIIVTLLIIF